MAKINFDLEFSEHMSRADRDPDAAAAALLTIAQRLRQGQLLKPDVVEYLAGAIEASMVKPQKNRGAALLREFKLTTGNRPPVNVDCLEVGRQFDASVISGKSQNQVASRLAVHYKISESTARNHWKKYLNYLEIVDRINAEEADQG